MRMCSISFTVCGARKLHARKSDDKQLNVDFTISKY